MKTQHKLKLKWHCQEPGWWLTRRIDGNASIYFYNQAIVCKEAGNLWHAYINGNDCSRNTKGFKTMRQAMYEAERQLNKLGKKH